MFFPNGDHNNLDFDNPIEMICYILLKIIKGYTVDVITDRRFAKKSVENLVNHMYDQDLIFRVFGKNLTIKRTNIYESDNNTITYVKDDINYLHGIVRKMSKESYEAYRRPRATEGD